MATQPVVVMPAPLTRLAETALETLRGALNAFAGRDAGAEGAIRAASEAGGGGLRLALSLSMATMIANPQGSASAANLLFAAQSLAKVAGLAAEIARLVHFAATGQRPAGRSSPHRKQDPCPSAKTRLLLAEDDPAMVELLRWTFEKEGFEVVQHAERRGSPAARRRNRRRTSSSSTGCSRSCPGSRSAGGCAARPKPPTSRSSCSPPAARKPTGCAGSRPARTITSPSRSARPSWSPGSGRCFGGSGRRLPEWCSASATSSSTWPPTRCGAAATTVAVGPTEFKLLRHFLEHPGHVFSRERLLDAVWGRDSDIETRTVDVYVRRLRRAINVARQGRPHPHRPVGGLRARQPRPEMGRVAILAARSAGFAVAVVGAPMPGSRPRPQPRSRRPPARPLPPGPLPAAAPEAAPTPAPIRRLGRRAHPLRSERRRLDGARGDHRVAARRPAARPGREATIRPGLRLTEVGVGLRHLRSPAAQAVAARAQPLRRAAAARPRRGAAGGERSGRSRRRCFATS